MALTILFIALNLKVIIAITYIVLFAVFKTFK